jgi:hypothetical protein
MYPAVNTIGGSHVDFDWRLSLTQMAEFNSEIRGPLLTAQ